MIKAYAASQLRNQCRLLILGDGELRDQLELQIDAAGLSEDVLLPGCQSNPFPFFKRAQFMLLSNYSEGFPMVLIEAMALGLPILSVDCPTGPPEIIIDGVNGRLIEMDNAELLTTSMDDLFQQPELLSRFSTNGKAAIRHLTTQVIRQQWLALSGDDKVRDDVNIS